MLTKKQWDDRILGVSKNFRGTNNRTWCLTGNNVRLGGDIPSRSVLISLDPGPGDPKDRDPAKFKLGDISVWLTRDENKVAIIRALLTLITDWAAHGCKRSTVHHRFSEWAAVVGGVLEHHKVTGFLANQKRGRAARALRRAPGRLLRQVVRAVQGRAAGHEDAPRDAGQERRAG